MIPRIRGAAVSLAFALALLAGGCGGGASSTAAAPVAVATVELPAPVDPEGKAAPAAPTAIAAPPADPTAGAGNGAKVVQPESPPFVARFAAVFRTAASPAQPSFFGGDSIVLFTSPVTCDVAAVDQAGPERLRVGLSWSAGERSTFQQFVFKNGKGMKHMGSIEVLQAPGKKGDIGRIRLDSIPGANVTGGEIDALVCQ